MQHQSQLFLNILQISDLWQALHPNEVLQLMCPQLGLPLPIPSPSSPPAHPLSAWAIQRLRGVRCVLECVQSIKAAPHPRKVKVEEDQEAGEEDGAGEIVEEAEVLGRSGCGNGAVEGVEETEQHSPEDAKHKKEGQSMGEGLHAGLLVSSRKGGREEEQRGGVSDSRGEVRKEVPEQREGEEVRLFGMDRHGSRGVSFSLSFEGWTYGEMIFTTASSCITKWEIIRLGCGHIGISIGCGQSV